MSAPSRLAAKVSANFSSAIPCRIGLACLPLVLAAAAAGEEPTSHPPMRPLPRASQRPPADGPAYYVDAARGSDQHAGSQQQPWKTLAHAVGRLQAGDTLYLRGGTYYEGVTATLAGTADKPITIRSQPGELAILDGGIRDFFEQPQTAWEPVPDGMADEYRSTRGYLKGGGFGQFGDSLIPFQRYLTFADLRSANEFYRPELGNRSDDPTGIYAGPGVRRNAETGRIHIRLAHTKLPGLGANAYRGETDPRKLPLVISGHDYALTLEGCRHLRLQDVVLRGGERAALLITRHMEDTSQDSEDIELDGVTLYGSGSALRASHTSRLKVANCAFRGHAAPWHSRFHHKDRAGAGYLIVAEGRDWEISHCELTDHHDFLAFQGLENLRFHHNLVDNFNDDGFEPGPKKVRGTAHIYQNLISRCLNPFTAHASKPVPVDSEPGSGVYIYRNVMDFRRGTYGLPPAEDDPSGKYLERQTQLVCHDHGSPVHAVYYVYHNTLVMQGPAFRDYYGFAWAGHTFATTRRIFNNIFIQADGLPGLNFTGASVEDDFQADGNLLWGLKDGPTLDAPFFDTFRGSSIFAASTRQYPPGWGANDLFADPRLMACDAAGQQPLDARLQPGSPAINSGVKLPADWPDALKTVDTDRPDIGAFPQGAEPLSVGIIDD
ncbi:MAG: hypothetical protein AB7O62_07015 [Pirellulales bacterium]